MPIPSVDQVPRTDDSTVGDVIECRIESLAHGIFGVARSDRGTVLVPAVAPGDRARVRIVGEPSGHREGELVELLEPSPVRREPPCRYVPECGGCTWQHVEYPAQLAAKEASLRRELVRGGGFRDQELEILPIVPSSEWSYRQRVNLRVGGEQRLGFYQHRSHRLVEIDHCLIADDVVNRHLSTAREWLRGVSTTIRRLEVASSGDGRVTLVANAEGPFRHDGEYHAKFVRERSGVAGIVIFGSGWRHSFGAPRIRLEVDDGIVIETASGFTQVNPDANRALVAAVLAAAAPAPTDRVLDLYCGAGNLTLPLARKVSEVIGVDVDSQGIGDARRNADRADIGNCRFVQQSAPAAARGLAAEGERFTLIVIDPPRAGAREVVDHLPLLGADRLVYVSCNPATLARDLRVLAHHGYRPGSIQPIDLFPQTYHLEIVARVDRRS
ncbi:MAG: rRNA (uracil1939-C5)-methyltransferase [Candidatus Binatota bacterium]|nr:rRNA (uracil1939-C5)-methyltransferase [Candidatus Binatota bacterium]